METADVAAGVVAGHVRLVAEALGSDPDPDAPMPVLVAAQSGIAGVRTVLAGLRAAGVNEPVVVTCPPSSGVPEPARAALDVGRPGTLVVANAQWADTAVLDLIAGCSARMGGPRLIVCWCPDLVLAGSRQEVVLAALGAAGSGPIARTVELVPLEPAQLRAFAAALLGTEAAARLVNGGIDALAERTGGLPVLARDLLVGAPVTGATGIARARLAAATPAGRAFAESLAIFGVPTHVDVVAAAAGIEPAALEDAVVDAERSRLVDIRPGGLAAFTATLLADAVAGALPAVTRRRLHTAAAGALRTHLPDRFERIAAHAREGSDPGAWLAASEALADASLARGNDRLAIETLLEVARVEDFPDGERVRLAKRLGEITAQRSARAGALLQPVIDALRDVISGCATTPADQGDLRSQLGRLLFQHGDVEAGRRELERSAEHLGHDPVAAARAMTYLGWPWSGPWPVERHVAWLERAGRLAAAIPAEADRISLTGDRAAALLLLGDPSGWSAAAQLPEEPATAEGRRQLTRARINIGYVAVVWGRFDDARRALTSGLTLAEAIPFDRLVSAFEVTLAHLDLRSGEWAGLEQRVRALMTPEATEPNNEPEGTLVWGLLETALGRPQRGAARLRAVIETTRNAGMVELHAAAAAGLARIDLAAHRPVDAVAVTDEPAEALAAKGLWLGGAYLVPVRVRALIAVGRAAEAHSLTDRFGRGVLDVGAPLTEAAVLSCRAELARAAGDWMGAADAFERASAAWQRLPSPYEVALCAEDQARCLLSAGRAADAAPVLDAAADVFTQLRARIDSRRVSELQVAHELATTHSRSGSYGDRLSPREAEVTALVAEGLTDRDIAKRLYLSEHTVMSHLKSARRKLGVRTRTELAFAVAAGPARITDSGDAADGPATTE